MNPQAASLLVIVLCISLFGGCDSAISATSANTLVPAQAPSSASGCPAAGNGMECGGHGVCNNGVCFCEPGFRSSTCEQVTCPHACGVNGKCIGTKCKCLIGYGGPKCDTVQCPQPNCSNHGKCEYGAPGTMPTCFCEPGWKGSGCHLRLCPLGPVTGFECDNNGQCVGGHCVCSPGYSGASCSQRTCNTSCAEDASCIDGNCVCNEGFYGKDCELKHCIGGCLHGKCINTGECLCNEGWSGPTCALKVCPRECPYHGVCNGAYCICKPGWTGESCDKIACPNDCSYWRQQGDCIFDKCECYAGFSGDDCSETINNPQVHPCGEPCEEKCRLSNACPRELKSYIDMKRPGGALARVHLPVTLPVPKARPAVPVDTPTPGVVLMELRAAQRSRQRGAMSVAAMQDKACFLKCVTVCTTRCFNIMHQKDKKFRTEAIYYSGGVTGDILKVHNGKNVTFSGVSLLGNGTYVNGTRVNGTNLQLVPPGSASIGQLVDPSLLLGTLDSEFAKLNSGVSPKAAAPPPLVQAAATTATAATPATTATTTPTPQQGGV